MTKNWVVSEVHFSNLFTKNFAGLSAFFVKLLRFFSISVFKTTHAIFFVFFLHAGISKTTFAALRLQIFRFLVRKKPFLNSELAKQPTTFFFSYPKQNRTELAQLITDYCFIRANYDGRSIWNFKNAFLFGFGIITTLGYGLIEPMTINGRMFTVIFGFIGIPITVIMLTNFGRYLQNLEVYMSHRFFNNKTKNGEDSQETDELEQISMTLLFSTVFLYLVRTFSYKNHCFYLLGQLFQVVGAIFIPIFNGQFDFFNGIYYAYLCLTALEFGELIPKEK